MNSTDRFVAPLIVFAGAAATMLGCKAIEDLRSARSHSPSATSSSPTPSPPVSPTDMAARRLPDLAVPSQRTVSWRLFACKNAPGCSSNGIAGSCGELGVKALSVVVTQDVTHERAVTRVPCPVENGSGEILVTVPAPQSRGPWTMRVVSDDTPTLRSEVLCNLTPRCWEKQRFVLPLYARGCNDPECVRCSESNHTPGWCD